MCGAPVNCETLVDTEVLHSSSSLGLSGNVSTSRLSESSESDVSIGIGIDKAELLLLLEALLDDELLLELDRGMMRELLEASVSLLDVRSMMLSLAATFAAATRRLADCSDSGRRGILTTGCECVLRKRASAISMLLDDPVCRPRRLDKLTRWRRDGTAGESGAVVDPVWALLEVVG